MRTTYGPIPREIPPEYLRTLAPTRETTSVREAITEPIIIEDEQGTVSTGELPATRESSGSNTIITSVCIIVAIVVIGSWLGSLFVSSTIPSPTASQKIIRVNQLDPSQYESAAQYHLWAYSTCSAAAMTAVINAYGHNYRLADILKVEANQGQITPELGLLYGVSSVARTVALFGFKAVALDSTTLDSILAAANSGTPVIVGFRDPVDFPTGHILVVKGGSGNTVDMVDSSKLNFQSLSRERFLHFYDGFAVLVTPINATANDTSAPVPATGNAYSVVGSPTVSASFINRVLAYYGSPVQGNGQYIYDDGVKYGIDPVYALAFFRHESSFGLAGEARESLSIGNLRCVPDELSCTDGYAWFSSWDAGIDAWYQLIKLGYVDGQVSSRCPCITIPQIITVYAPPSDNNNDAAYIAAVEAAVSAWRSGEVAA